MTTTKTLFGLVGLSILLFVFLPLVDWGALPKFLVVLYWVSFVVCYFSMLIVQWGLSSKFKINKFHLLLYLLHPYVSVGVFSYFYYKRNRRREVDEP